ncbi:MAG: GYD domain-containing protein [Pyrinomonadaceae bacterium]
MAHYLIQISYTSEAWRTLIKNPQNRVEAVRPVIENLGGVIENAWFTFGEYDVVWLIEMPEQVNIAAFSFAVSAGGAVKSIKTTPLISIEDAVLSMQRAAEIEYQPPSNYLNVIEQNR